MKVKRIVRRAAGRDAPTKPGAGPPRRRHGRHKSEQVEQKRPKLPDFAAGSTMRCAWVGWAAAFALAAFLLAPVWINGETIALDGGQWLTGGGGFKDYMDWTDADWDAARARIRARNQADKAQR